MRRLLSLFVVALVATASGCGGPAAVTGIERFTQGGVSMEPTVKAGQVITVRSVGDGYQPRRGDIVLFHGGSDKWGADTTAPFLKRVIAVGGEVIACCDVTGSVTVDGTALHEPYVADNAPLDLRPSPDQCGSRRFDTVKVPADSVFVMGDNRGKSIDSRCAGPIPASSVFAVMVG